MKAITVFKKFITIITCSTLVLTQVALAETPPPQNPQDETVVQSEEKKEKPHDANYCLEDASLQATIKSCEDSNLKYNCHLQKCVSYDDNLVYNEEYNDCGYHSTEESKEKCRNNLKSVSDELDQSQSKTDKSASVANKNGSSSAEKASAGMTAGLAIAGAVELGCLLASGGSALDWATICWSKAFSLAVGAAALMYQMSAKGKYEGKFKSAKEMLKNIDKSDKKGWNHNTQVATLDMQIRALELIRDAAKEKSKYHQVLITMSTASLVAGITNAIICTPKPVSHCPQEVGCAWKVAAVSAIYIVLEQAALSHTKKAESDASKALTDAKKIRRKIQSLYNKDRDSLIMANPSLAMGGQGQGQLQMAQVAANGENAQGIDGSLDAPSSQCISKDNEVVSCPCTDGGCKKFDLNIPGNSKLANQLNKKMNFSEYEKGMNSVANGNVSGLDFAADPGKSAINQKIANRLMKKALKNKYINKKTKETFEDILGGIGRPGVFEKYAKIKSPLQTALLMNKYGIGGKGLGLDSTDKESEEKVAKDEKKGFKAKDLATYSGSRSAIEDIQKRLQALQDNIDLGDIDTLNDVALNDGNGEIVDKGLGPEGLETDTEKAVVHPDEKISIFKIISNRYNILRVRKRFSK